MFIKSILLAILITVLFTGCLSFNITIVNYKPIEKTTCLQLLDSYNLDSVNAFCQNDTDIHYNIVSNIDIDGAISSTCDGYGILQYLFLDENQYCIETNSLVFCKNSTDCLNKIAAEKNNYKYIAFTWL